MIKIQQFEEKLAKIRESAMFLSEMSEQHKNGIRREQMQVYEEKEDEKFHKNMLGKQKAKHIAL